LPGTGHSNGDLTQQTNPVVPPTVGKTPASARRFAPARWPLATFFALTFAFTWALLPLARTSVAFSLIALCGPAFAAFVSAAFCGRGELRALARRMTLWRVGARWYVAALLLPVVASAVASGLEYLGGAGGPIRWQPISVLQAVVFVLVAGEEIGWRGFALPILLARFGPWRASLVLGVVWALWHLPLFYLPEMPQFGSPFAAFVPYTIALSVLLTVLAERTGCSVIVATLFHGSVNTLGLVNAAAGPGERSAGNAAAYGLAALVVGGLAWRGRRRE
jgi:membrane protease YdiL (CAAX protease family)